MKKLSITLAIIFGLFALRHLFDDPRLGYHLLVGQGLLQNLFSPTALSPTQLEALNQQNSNWISQVLMALSYSLGGSLGLVGLSISVSLLLFFQISRLIRKIGGTYRFTFSDQVFAILPMVLLLLGNLQLGPRLLVLPLVLVGVELIRGRSSTQKSATFLLLTIISANVHPLWVVFPLTWIIYKLIPRLLNRADSMSASKVWGIFLLLILAGSATPSGVNGYQILWKYTQINHNIFSILSEMSPTFSNRGIIPWAILVIACLGVSSFNKVTAFTKQPSAVDLDYLADATIAMLGILLSIASTFFIPLCALLILPYWIQSVQSLKENSTGVIRRSLCFATASMFSIYILTSFYAGLIREQITLDGLNTKYPVKACTSIASDLPSSKKEATQTRVLTHFKHGGWCRWAVNALHTSNTYEFIPNGRDFLLNDNEVIKVASLYSLHDNWKGTLAGVKPKYIVVENTQPLKQILALLPQWQLIYHDPIFSTYFNSSN